MRCFVAVWPAPDVVEALGALARPETAGLRWTSREQWHVTLRFFGDIDAQGVTEASAVLALVADRASEAPEANGGPGTRFLGSGLLIWPVAGVAQLAKEVERLTATIGKPPPSRNFYGHVTLARARPGVDLRPATQLLSPLAMSWTATSLTLVESELHADGARYRVLDEFPFPGQPPSGSG
jgi:RNA 2',3'-cyclic 3'-phosphodiesterase